MGIQQEAKTEPDIRGEGTLSEQVSRLNNLSQWYLNEGNSPFLGDWTEHGQENFVYEMEYIAARSKQLVVVGFSDEDMGKVGLDLVDEKALLDFGTTIGGKRTVQLDDKARYLSNVAKGFESLPEGVEIEGINK